MPDAEFIRSGPDVKVVFDRMEEIASLIGPTQSDRAIVEYSALLCVAVAVFAISNGIPLSQENLSRYMRAAANAIVPALEAELDAG